MASVTRTIEPGISMFSAGEIRVAFVPIGPVPRDKYEAYLDAFNKQRHVPLHSVRALHQETHKSPFSHIPWRTGALHLRYLADDEARRRTRIAELHAQRAVLAVVGVVHCPLVEDLTTAHAEFLRAARQFPDALVARCCAFDPAEHHLQAAAALRDVMLFPAGTPAQLEAHVAAYAPELGAALLAATEQWVLTASVAGVKLNTHVDSAEFTGPLSIQDGLQKLNANEDELREKKRWGRLQKTKGDVALISGAPRDAYDHYKSGMELSKIAGDTVWTAAALEGLAHARVMEALSRGDGTGGAFKRSLALAPGAAATAAAVATGAAPPGSPAPASPRTAVSPAPGDRSASSSPTKSAAVNSDGCSWPLVNAAMWSALRSAGLEGEVRELLSEAQGWYRRKGGALALQIECALKLARFLAGLRGKAARSEGLDLLGGALELVPQLPLLEDRLVALVEAAQVMGLLGCGRKRQLLLWAAVDLSRAVDRSDTLALRIATRALEPPDDPEAQDPDDLPRRHWVQRRSPLPIFDPTRGGSGGSWEAIQLATAEAALSAARSANSPIEAWEAAALIVREHGARLPQTYQATLLDALAQAASRFPQRALQRRGPGPGPLAQLRRIVPPPPALAPLRISGPLTSAASRRGDGGGHGPFIFNPYAQKRQQGAAAAAAEGAVVEWVAGDEARVEVVLANPLAVPLRIDGISLAVQDAEGGETLSRAPRVSAGAVASPSKQQQQAAVAASPGRQDGSGGGGGNDGGSAGGGGSAASAAVGSVVTVSPVSVTLPPGGKPVKVILALTPHRPGDLLLRGVLVTAWGVTWEQPLTLLPRLGPLVTPGALRPQPPQRVRVLPRLPLLRASLAGPDVRVVTPDEGLGGSSSSRGGTGGGAGGPGNAPSPTAGGPASPSSGGLGKPASVPVFEGQHLLWTLTLANVSDQTIGACAVAVVNSKGAPARTPAGPGGQLPASFLGVHLDTSSAEEQLNGGMPLEPRQSVSLPLSLVVGRPPADPFEEVLLELRITYTPTACAGVDSTTTSTAEGSSPETVGRRVSLPLRFAIQPSLGITAVRFLQMGVPLRDGGRYAPPGVNLRDAALTRDAALYRCVTSVRGATAGGAGGGLVRNNSEGALPSPSAAAALARQQQQFAAQAQQQRDLRASGGGLHAQHRHSSQQGLDPQQQLWAEVEEQTRDLSSSTPRGAGPRVTLPGSSGAGPPSPTRHGAAGSAPPAVAAPPASDLGLSSDSVLELAVVNRSDRYFRTWLARLPDGPGADGAESAVVVLEPGDDARLLAPLLPDASAGSGGGGGGAGGPGRPVPAGAHEPPSRIACAERLVESLGVRWEMITGDVAPDRLPRGLVRLAPVDVAHSVTPAAVASLAPSELHARVVALPAPGAAPIELADVSAATRSLGVRLTSIVGPVWAVRTAVGRPLVIEVRLTHSGPQEEAVRITLVASDLAAGGDSPDGGAGAPGGPRLSLEGSSPPPAGAGAADGADGGLLLTGRCERVGLVVPSGGGAVLHRVSMLPLRPGLYQVAVTDARSSDGSALYLTQDRLRLLVQRPLTDFVPSF